MQGRLVLVYVHIHNISLETYGQSPASSVV